VAYLTKDEDRLLQKVLTEVAHKDRDFYDTLSAAEKRLVLDVLREDSQGLHGGIKDTLWEVDYDRKPVSISEFLTGKEYLGMDILRNEDDEARTSGIFECWYDTLCELFDPRNKYHELVVAAAIGTGKTSMASLGMVYKLYQMSCLTNPQSFYGLLPGHKIVFGVFTVFKYKARELGGDYIRKAVEGSPYFREVFPFNPHKTIDLEFPKSMSLIYGSSALSAIGLNVFSALIDEAEFMKAGTSEADRGQAFELYNSIVRRMESRFMRQGIMPGIMFQISSKASADSYLTDRIKSKGSNQGIMVVEKTGWEVKPWRYTGKMFPCFIGDEYSDPRILDESELDEIADMSRVMMIPEEHKMAFHDDMFGSLRDIANVSTGASNPLIPNKKYIFDAIDPTRSHPFTKEEFHIGLNDDLSISDFIDVKKLIGTKRGQPVPRLNPNAPRCIHLDLAISQDSLGFSMGHIAQITTIEKPDKENPGLVKEVNLPVIVMDMVLRIVPAVGSKIRFSAIRDFIVHLRQYGYTISLVTADTFQSTDMIQQLIRMGFTAENLSVDVAKTKDAAPYAYLRDAFTDGRLKMYDYPLLNTELANLQRIDIVKDGKMKIKVDHPAKMNHEGNPIRGSKDIADSVCGVVYNCMTRDMTQDTRMPKKEREKKTTTTIEDNKISRRFKRVTLANNLATSEFDDYDG
jgi:hypothetical protein